MAETKKYIEMTREELEAEEKALAKDRTRIREAQVEVSGLLDAYRAMEAANLDPATVKQMYRISQVQAAGDSEGKRQ